MKFGKPLSEIRLIPRRPAKLVVEAETETEEHVPDESVITEVPTSVSQSDVSYLMTGLVTLW